jgi:hypothetical protein
MKLGLEITLYLQAVVVVGDHHLDKGTCSSSLTLFLAWG